MSLPRGAWVLGFAKIFFLLPHVYGICACTTVYLRVEARVWRWELSLLIPFYFIVCRTWSSHISCKQAWKIPSLRSPALASNVALCMGTGVLALSELKSSCLCGKHVTDWAISLAPAVTFLCYQRGFWGLGKTLLPCSLHLGPGAHIAPLSYHLIHISTLANRRSDTFLFGSPPVLVFAFHLYFTVLSSCFTSTW